MGYTLGVDLGTTYSAAAISRGGAADRIPLGTRSAVIPSVVCLRADGEVLVGEAAERRGLIEPTRTAREFKRRLGDPTPLLLGGTPYGAESLMAHLLRWIVDRVEEQQGSAADAVVLSHPANWGPYKLDLLQQTVRFAEVEDVSFLTEPEAAAVHYAGQERLDPDEVVAVYDFGGGTFDAAVLRRTGSGFELLGAPEGMERIGGIDFDQAVFAHVDGALGGAVRELDPDDTSAMAAVSRLRDECQLAKEQLSHDTDVDIPVLLPGLQTEVRLTRSEFEGMIRPRVGETIRALDRAVRSAGLGMDDVAKVLLVGGSSRIPLVGQLVREETGRPIAIDAHPKFAIAIGASVVGAEGATRSAPATPAAGGVDETAPLATNVDDTAPVPVTDETSRIDGAGGGPPDEGGDATPDAEDASPDEPVDHTPTEEVPKVAATAVAAGSAVGGARVAGGGPPGTTTGGASADGDGGGGGSSRRRSLLLLGAGLIGLLVVLAIVRPDGDDPADAPAEDVPVADESPDPDEDERAALPSPTPSPEVDPSVESVEVAVTDDQIEVSYVTAGYEPTDAGYGLEIGWVEQIGEPALSWTPVDGASSYAYLSTFERPLPGRAVCLRATTPDGPSAVAEDDCAWVDEAGAGGMPGERFLVLDAVTETDGRYVVDYTPYGYTPDLGDTGTWHVHFFWWPTWDEDVVGANVPNEQRGSWSAWDATVFDAFEVATRPADATHICGVVAEYDHTILLQEDGTGYPSGTCVALP